MKKVSKTSSYNYARKIQSKSIHIFLFVILGMTFSVSYGQTSMYIPEKFQSSANNEVHVQIKNQWKADDYLHMENGTLEASSLGLPGWWSAHWIITSSQGSNSFTIVNRYLKKAIALDNNGKLTTVDTPSSSNLAKWTFENIPGTNFYRIKNYSHNTKTIHHENTQIACDKTPQGWLSARWELILVTKTITATRTTRKADIPTGNANSATNTSSCQITFTNTNSTSLIYYLNNDKSNPKVIGGNQSKIASASLGDVFSFELTMASATGGKVIPDYTVDNRSCGNSHALALQQKQYDPDNLKGTTFLGNIAASRNSFDILKIDPIFIATPMTKQVRAFGNKKVSGGMGKQVFKSLDHASSNWHLIDGKIVLENHFDKVDVNSGFANSKSRIAFSARDFSRSFSGNIEVGGGFKGVKGSNSAAFNYADGKSKSNKNAFAFSRETATKYTIELIKNKIELDDSFIQAIRALTIPSSTPSSASQAKSSNGYSSYTDFIATWGTHYPVSTDYGGMKVAITNADITKIGSNKNWGLDLKNTAEIDLKKVSAKRTTGFGYNQSESTQDNNSSSETISFYKGGEGNSSNWEVTDGSLQPIEIKLERLSELLVNSANFNGLINDADLRKKKQMLEYALENYLQSAEDQGQAIRPKMYKLSNFNWKLKEGQGNYDYANVFGDIIIRTSSDSKGTVNHFVKKIYHEDEDKRVTAKEGIVQKCNYDNFTDIYITETPAFDGSFGGFTFVIESHLVNWHPGWINQEGVYGDKGKRKMVSSIQSGKNILYLDQKSIAINSPTVLKKEIKNDQGTIELSYTIQEVELPTDWGFDF